ncbi:MAG: hypothetical protein M1816_003710 [Peltula sp. TS41687]|nr:MAG: hypothetical protein M1816_003710 [Peltula sp. TS41687]
MALPIPDTHSSFASALAEALPIGVKFTIYHLSSPPTKCASIFAAAPDAEPDRTYCESHYLSIAIQPGKSETQPDSAQHLLVFAIEALIYTTKSLTTIFVSKADSTGYLHLLNLPKGTPSPLKTVASTFLNHLVQTRRRAGVKLCISLFARAQDQYLFPGSVENVGKHLLDDRGLIRWWCQVLDPLVRKTEGAQDPNQTTRDNARSSMTRGYIIVPGLEQVEASHLLPSIVQSDPPTERRWIVGHPLHLLSDRSDLPPRCLIPHFPDDPKARFIDELDEELLDVTNGDLTISPSKSRRSNGRWKSVSDLEQFWEAMEFRQECSSGRLVGFIWVVFPAESSSKQKEDIATASGSPTAFESIQSPAEALSPTSPLPNEFQGRYTSRQLSRSFSAFDEEEQKSSKQSPSRPRASSGSPRKSKLPKLSGPIITRQPRIKGSTSPSSTTKQPAQTPYYLWSVAGRGQVVLAQKDYTRVTAFLLKLDFKTPEIARLSTARWLQAPLSRNETWGETVVGRQVVRSTPPVSHAEEQRVNTLDVSMIRKKRKRLD